MVIAGLVSRQISNNQTYTPKLHNVPGVGLITESFEKGDQDLELVIIVTPTIVRQPMKNLALWQFPPARGLLSSFVGEPDISGLPKRLDPRSRKERKE